MKMKLPETDVIMKGVYLVAALLVLFLVFKLLSGLGIIRTKKKKLKDIKKKESMSDFRTMDYFNPNYKDTHMFKKIGINKANDYAQRLKKALYPWVTFGLGTNEEGIYSIFGELDNKGNISEISSQYYLRYDRDLRTDILNDLKTKEIVTLTDIINKLPEL